jgi:hypothetical protein
MQKCCVPTVATRYWKSQESRRLIVVHGLLHPMCCCRRSFFEGLFQPTTVPTAQQKEAVIRIAAFAPAANKANGDGAIGCTAR